MTCKAAVTGSTGQARVTARWVSAVFVCLLVFTAGCSWTGRMLGMGSDEPAASQKAEPAKSAETQTAEPAPAAAAPIATPATATPLSVDFGIERQVTPGASQPAAGQAVVSQPPANQPLEKAVPLPQRAEPAAPAPASVAPGKNVASLGVRGPVLRDNGDLEYFNAESLQAAIKAAMEKKTFLGYTDPFHAFPVFQGNDTVSGAFNPVDHPNHKVFFHTFYLPDRPFHKRIYGYTVINLRTNGDFGHFDGDGDGVFEQRTLEPKIVLDSYQAQPPAPALVAPPSVPPKKP